ncbi:hypothetical protein Clacol_009723 [Clathrus columnatus]|uniref:Ribonucleoside-diphosphate reductase n=1 Tax=Clathrus columnatus TaxID=1419009 RepID=A0AAV5AU77_9AGAM|nr:hypothetical protein Clacol_009723 [Clathrus columnatus]
MRVAVGIHGHDIERAIETYHLMSQRFFTHASPTLFNAGTPHPQLASCFLICKKDDSIEGIYDTLKTCAMISKTAGGIGMSIHNIRATGSYIAGTNGYSNSIVPMLRAYDATARYVDQGGNKRPGAFIIYVEPWYADIFEFLDLRKNHGKEEARARDLFYALWILDLFMKCVQADVKWLLFCPNEPGLHEVYGAEFEALYERYEIEGRAKKTVGAQKLWFAVLDAQIETGGPFMCYKDASNGDLTCVIFRLPFDSEQAKELNIQIFETIYHAAVEASCDMAETDDPYETFQGSPASQGRLQFDLWGGTPTSLWEWTNLKARAQRVGLRNSLLCAPMPTAPTSQILGNNECFEPYTNIAEIPDDVEAIYKTVWEISQKKVLNTAADRGVYLRTRPAAQAIQFTVDQSYLKKKTVTPQSQPSQPEQPKIQSTTIPTPSPSPKPKSEPSVGTVTTELKQLDVAGPQQQEITMATTFTTATTTSTIPVGRTAKAAAEDPEFAAALQRQRDRELEEAKLYCSLDNKEACLMCSG